MDPEGSTKGRAKDPPNLLLGDYKLHVIFCFQQAVIWAFRYYKWNNEISTSTLPNWLPLDLHIMLRGGKKKFKAQIFQGFISRCKLSVTSNQWHSSLAYYWKTSLAAFMFTAWESPTYIGSEEPDPVVVAQPTDDDREESLLILVCNAHQLRAVCHAGF